MKNLIISRRRFLGVASAVAATAVVPFDFSTVAGTKRKKPDSKVAGVQLGCPNLQLQDGSS